MTTFNPDQQEVIDYAKTNKSFFISGYAGAGKSTTLQGVYEVLPETTTLMTATTGLAAFSIKGQTIHSALGLGILESSAEEIASNTKGVILKIWQSVTHLIIDECSMLHADAFEKIEKIARIIRKNDKIFGGIVVILIGDFAQLGPIGDKNVRYLFESPLWDKLIKKTFMLTKIIRQKDDTKFMELLSELRNGGPLAEESIKLLKLCEREVIYEDGIKPVILYAKRYQVDNKNTQELAKLPGELIIHNAVDGGDMKLIEQQIRAPKQVKFKIGAQVMLTKNMTEHNLGNGSQGVIIDIINRFPKVRFIDGKILVIQPTEFNIMKNKRCLASRKQLPIDISFAMTIHKSQGQTYQRGFIPAVGDIFADSQFYVALSRFQSLENVQIIGFDPMKVTTNRKVIEFYNKLVGGSQKRKREQEEEEPIKKKKTTSELYNKIQALRKDNIHAERITEEEIKDYINQAFGGTISENKIREYTISTNKGDSQWMINFI